MNTPSIPSATRQRAAKLALLAFSLASLSCTLFLMTQGCDLLHAAGWAALELARPVISALLQSIPAHLCGCSSFAQSLLQIVATNWPVLGALAG